MFLTVQSFLEQRLKPIQMKSKTSLMTQDPLFKIGDYGTLRERGRKHLHYFVSGFGFTPEYASPETLDLGTNRAGPQVVGAKA